MCKHKNRVKVDHSKPGAYGDSVCKDCGAVFYDCGFVGVIIFAPFIAFSLVMLWSVVKGWL